MNIDNRDRQLQLVTGLCRELSKLGLSVGMSDARPAAVIRTSETPPLWITVDASAEFFEWADAEHRHPVADTARTAALISEYAQAQRSESGDES